MRATIKVFLTVVAVGLGSGQAMAGMVDFESASVGFGNDFSSEGVTFSSGDIAGDTLGAPLAVAINDVITYSETSADIFVTNNGSFQVGGSTQSAFPSSFSLGLDVLMSFTDPVTDVSLTTDNDTPNTVRLLALESTGNPNEFTVVGVDESDNSGGGQTLSVDLGGTTFTHAIFQSTSSDFEAFDNVMFTTGTTPVPEPSSVAMIGAGLLLIGFGNGRKKFRA